VIAVSFFIAPPRPQDSLNHGTTSRIRYQEPLAYAANSEAAAQIDFAATIVNLSASSNTFQTRIFSTAGKLRFQGQDKSGRTNSIMIVDLAAGTSIVLIPQQHQYVQQTRPQIPGQGMTFFQSEDAEDACGKWQKMAPTDKETCRKIGHEAVHGRDAVKYESAPAQGESKFIWIDVRLHFPVKWKGPMGACELRNIIEGPQPKELFEIPAGYTKQMFGSTPQPKPPQ
jgi:hypothetical protein